jgi:hypothetical protein
MLLTAIFILVAIVAIGLTRIGRVGRIGEPIVHRPYNNRYNDASGARDHHHLS